MLNWHPFRRLRKSIRRQPITRLRLAVEELEARLAPSVNVLTYHYDIASSGLNQNETQLDGSVPRKAL